MKSGDQAKSTLRLAARKGEIRVRTNPADAEIFVNGRAHRSRTLQLPARPQRIEARKPGYETVATTIQPLPGFPIEIDLALPEDGQATVSAPESAPIAKKSGAQFIRFGPGRFTMGASRREQGRRSNETLHEVEFTRPFVMASHEVTNREFNAFDPQHSSGLLGGKVLNSPDQPVVNVSWDQAAAYANWLSEREGLPAVYELRGERYVSRDPIPTGYRLPTEAEWERVARSAGRSEPTRFPWGSSMPPAAESGNFADETARDVAPRTLTLYQDGYSVSAPVGSFLPNPAGIYDLGGNVREWAHDLYSIGGLPGDSLTVDPSGASSGRYHAVRGSSWRDASITRLRFTFRDYADQPLPDLGFRLARYPGVAHGLPRQPDKTSTVSLGDHSHQRGVPLPGQRKTTCEIRRQGKAECMNSNATRTGFVAPVESINLADHVVDRRPRKFIAKHVDADLVVGRPESSDGLGDPLGGATVAERLPTGKTLQDRLTTRFGVGNPTAGVAREHVFSHVAHHLDSL